MNKAITDGLVFQPPPFSAGLINWSSGDGTAGSPSYNGAANAALVPADSDFGGCLELLKTQTTQKLRAFLQTPIPAGCYLQVTVRVKAMSGALPSIRLAGLAVGAGDVPVPGVPSTGTSVALTAYGKVETLTAIIGSGNRPGVNLVWGTAPLAGHFGLDLTGSNGGVVRVDDIEITDVTAFFQRVMMDWVDVRDYGAKGDGVTDDRAAFQAADAAAGGRVVVISAGTHFLGDHVTFTAPTRFEGTVAMAIDKRLTLTRNFDLPSYEKAFGTELEGFKKGMQALFNAADHVTFDLAGRRIQVSAPIDIHTAVDNLDTFVTRRTVRNGQFDAVAGTGWNSDQVTSQATYVSTGMLTLTGVTNVANVQIGSLVTGNGVGRKIYVTAKNVGAGTLTISRPLTGSLGTQIFTFTRFKYILDFSGFSRLDRIEINDVEFNCNGVCSAIMLAPSGITFRVGDCVFNRVKDRAITSIGEGCQGMFVDRCQFISEDQSLPVSSRSTVALNVNANDTKIRHNRIVRFLHFAVLDGSGHIILGNHWFQGDDLTAGVRSAGLVLASPNLATVISGNYIDNCHIEWNNEHDAEPAFSSEYSFGGLSIIGNIFIASNVAPSFRWLVISPRGPGHFISGLNVSGNTFRTFNATVDRVDSADTTFSVLDYSRFRNVTFENNTFNGVTQLTTSPVSLEFQQNTAATTWTINVGAYMPFQAWARTVQSVVAVGQINGPGSEVRTDMPWVRTEQGASQQEVHLNWASSSRGTVQATIRCDRPV